MPLSWGNVDMSFSSSCEPADTRAMCLCLREPECAYRGPEPCRWALNLFAWDRSDISVDFCADRLNGSHFKCSTLGYQLKVPPATSTSDSQPFYWWVWGGYDN